jgi:hypothetical protein
VGILKGHITSFVITYIHILFFKYVSNCYILFLNAKSSAVSPVKTRMNANSELKSKSRTMIHGSVLPLKCIMCPLRYFLATVFEILYDDLSFSKLFHV